MCVVGGINKDASRPDVFERVRDLVKRAAVTVATGRNANVADRTWLDGCIQTTETNDILR